AFFKETATTEIYTLLIVGSVRCVYETAVALVAPPGYSVTPGPGVAAEPVGWALYTSPSPRDIAQAGMASSAGKEAT
ncbi:hypothetical protein J8J19_24260, partial [Mycobacterium tuberculosis]|nr:hypothetical protein [Mycobacterium tuberculosis]